MECGAFQTQVDLNMAQNYVDQYDDAEWDWGQGAALEGSRMMSRKLCGDMKDLLADNQGLNIDLERLLATGISFAASMNNSSFGACSLKNLLQRLLTDVKKSAKAMSKVT